MVGHVSAVASPPLFTVWARTYLTRWQQALRLREGGAASSSMTVIDTSRWNHIRKICSANKYTNKHTNEHVHSYVISSVKSLCVSEVHQTPTKTVSSYSKMSTGSISVTCLVQLTVFHHYMETKQQKAETTDDFITHFTADSIFPLHQRSSAGCCLINSSFQLIGASVPALEPRTANEWTCRAVSLSVWATYTQPLDDWLTGINVLSCIPPLQAVNLEEAADHRGCYGRWICSSINPV